MNYNKGWKAVTANFKVAHFRNVFNTTNEIDELYNYVKQNPNELVNLHFGCYRDIERSLDGLCVQLAASNSLSELNLERWVRLIFRHTYDVLSFYQPKWWLERTTSLLHLTINSNYFTGLFQRNIQLTKKKTIFVVYKYCNGSLVAFWGQCLHLFVDNTIYSSV